MNELNKSSLSKVLSKRSCVAVELGIEANQLGSMNEVWDVIGIEGGTLSALESGLENGWMGFTDADFVGEDEVVEEFKDRVVGESEVEMAFIGVRKKNEADTAALQLFDEAPDFLVGGENI